MIRIEQTDAESPRESPLVSVKMISHERVAPGADHGSLILGTGIHKFADPDMPALSDE